MILGADFVGSNILRSACVISIAALLAVVIFLWNHVPLPALPEEISPDLEPSHSTEFRLGAVDAVKEILGLAVGLAIGLSAVVGFVIKDGFGNQRAVMLFNLAIIGLFFYFICRVFVFGYDGYATIAVQLDRGFVFLGHLQQIVGYQLRSLAWASLSALTLLFANYAWMRDPGA